MGGCVSTPDDLIVGPIIKDNFKRNRNSHLKQGSNTLASNWSGTGTYLGVESIDHDKYRIELYEAVYLRNWGKVTELMNGTRFMQSADYLDHNERTCLHWACIKSAPLPITQNLIAAYADAVLMQDHLGKTPLHLACEFGTNSSIYLLLGASSQATLLRDTVNGRTPLAESLIGHRSPSVIDNLLTSNPKSIILPDNNANTPTVMFFNMTLGVFMSFTGKAKGTWKCCNDNIEDLIEIARNLLRAEIQELDTSTQGSQPQDYLNENEGSSILLDSILSPTCPSAFVEFLLSAYPELADVRNRTGDLPIHLAASLTPDSLKKLSQIYKCYGCGEPQSDNVAHYYRRDPKVHHRQLLCHECIDKSQVSHYKENTGGNKVEVIIKALLSINPAYAQKCNQEDLTPLNIGIKSGHGWDENSLDKLMGGCDENATPSTGRVGIESNHGRSISDNLETRVTIANLTENGASKPTTEINFLHASILSVAHDSVSITKDYLETSVTMKSTDLASDDNSQASLSSIAHDSKSMTEIVEKCEPIESVSINTPEEREETLDDSSHVSAENTCQSARWQPNLQIEENKPISTPLEDQEKTVDIGKPLGLVSSLRSHLTTSQGLSSVLELGIAVLT